MSDNGRDWLGGIEAAAAALGGRTGDRTRALASSLPDDWRPVLHIAGSRSPAIEPDEVVDLRDPLTFIEAVIEPIATRLGTAWEEDTMTFVDVTLVSNDLVGLLHAHEQEFGRRTASLEAGANSLLTIVEGRQHGLGMAAVAYQLRYAGWNVDLADYDDVERRLSLGRYDLLCLSVGHDGLIEGLDVRIGRFRSASLNRHLKVAVGGPGVSDFEKASVAKADIYAKGVPELLWKLNQIKRISKDIAGDFQKFASI